LKIVYMSRYETNMLPSPYIHVRTYVRKSCVRAGMRPCGSVCMQARMHAYVHSETEIKSGIDMANEDTKEMNS